VNLRRSGGKKIEVIMSGGVQRLIDQEGWRFFLGLPDFVEEILII
jgi:hypothetical protein